MQRKLGISRRLGMKICEVLTINIQPAASWRTSDPNNSSAGKVPFPGSSQPCCMAEQPEIVLVAGTRAGTMCASYCPWEPIEYNKAGGNLMPPGHLLPIDTENPSSSSLLSAPSDEFP